jgi:hypothetical protein
MTGLTYGRFDIESPPLDARALWQSHGAPSTAASASRPAPCDHGTVAERRQPSDLALAARAVIVAVTSRRLARLDLPTLARRIEPRTVATPPADTHEAARHGRRVVDRVLDRAPRFVPRGCIPRGFARYAVLRRMGVDATLCFGLGRPDGDIAGHCWITLEGDILFEPDETEATFTEVVRIAGGTLV